VSRAKSAAAGARWRVPTDRLGCVADVTHQCRLCENLEPENEPFVRWMRLEGHTGVAQMPSLNTDR
jgi:hypothetical protein